MKRRKNYIVDIFSKFLLEKELIHRDPVPYLEGKCGAFPIYKDQIP